MASDVQIANVSLGRLGASSINDINEDSENARKIKALWDLTVDEVIAEHPWNFAIDRATLALLDAEPEYDLPYYFQKPTDCLRIIEVSPKQAIWKPEQEDKIASDTSPLYCRFIKRVTDTSKWSAAFIKAFIARLAANLAYPITNSRTLAADLLAYYEDVELPKAKAMDAQEGSEEKFDDEHDWIQQRY